MLRTQEAPKWLCGIVALVSVMGVLSPAHAAAPSVEQVVRDLAAMESRFVGSPGLNRAADYVEKAFRDIGLQQVRRQPFRMAAPIEEFASLTVNGATWRLRALFPNFVRTCTTPREGLTGELLYARKGDLKDFDGKEVKGRIVLMDFDSGDNWVNAFTLGAQAVIFIAPPITSRQEAEAKFLSVPLNAPRFWMEREEGLKLVTTTVTARRAIRATLRARVTWQPVTCYNIWGKIPGSDPKLRDEHIVLSAYYDSISVVPTLAPGAESACGIAALLAIAQQLKAAKPKRTIVFVATSAHFMGLAGVATYSRGFEIAKTDGGTKLPAELDEDGTKTQALIAFYKRYFSTFEDADKKPTALFIGLDLSSGTRKVGLFARGSYEDNRDTARERSYAYVGKAFRETLRAMERETKGSHPTPQADEWFADTINPIQGRSADTFFPELPAFEAEVVSFFSGGVTLATCSDSRNLVDTPFDTPDRVNFGNLQAQVDLLSALLPRAFNDPEFPVWIQEPTLRNKGPLFGQVVTADPKKNIVPSKPVPNTVIVALRDLGWRGSFMRSSPKPIYGVHPNGYAMAEGKEAWYQLLHFQWPGNVRLEAFHFNDAGEIDYAPDLGSDGNAKFNFRQFAMNDKGGKVLNYVIFPCVSVTLIELVDPRYLVSLQNLKVLDADTEGDPHYFGIFLPLATRYDMSYVEPVAMVFVQRNAKIKVLMSLGLVGFRLVLINADVRSPQYKDRWSKPPLKGLLAMKHDHPQGRGFRITQPTIFSDAALQVTKDLWVLDDSRLRLLAQHGISNDRLNQLHRLALDALENAARARQQRQWSVARAETQQAWAFESAIYPDVAATANDVVKGVLFYLFLVLPFAYFVERLVCGFADIRRQIIGVAVVFTMVLVILAIVHPAFKITMTPFLIFLAFTIISLAALVIGIVLVKFSWELEQYRGGMRGVHRVDVNRLGALTAALNLGIANMRRRPLRNAYWSSFLPRRA
ncbi:MAG: M28 family peptidase [Abditibacteriales bacterium]|nr:M28 family peptidase [Abditibacteriales bacterium]